MTMAQDSSHPTGVTGNRTTALRARERKTNAALQMKLAGATWEEIADVIGYPTPRQALVAVERALERELKTEPSQAKMRALAGARLERLLRSCWSKAIDPAHPEHLVALAKAREIVDRHAKLYGLDAPTEVVVHNPTVHELEAWVATVVSETHPALPEYDIFEGEVVDAVQD
jgi:hypothetical protein